MEAKSEQSTYVAFLDDIFDSLNVLDFNEALGLDSSHISIFIKLPGGELFLLVHYFSIKNDAFFYV